MISKGSITTEIYSLFINKLIEIFTREEIIQKTVFICDNARIHHSKFSSRIFYEKFNFLFLPSYSPELNPIELCWSKWKREVRKDGCLNGEDDLVLRIFYAARKMEKSNFRAWFKHTIGFFKRSYLGQGFY